MKLLYCKKDTPVQQNQVIFGYNMIFLLEMFINDTNQITVIIKFYHI